MIKNSLVTASAVPLAILIRRLALALATGAVLLAAVAVLPRDGGVSVVEIDIETPQSSIVEVFWNDYLDPPVSMVNPGRGRFVRKVRVPETSLFRLRLDPTQRAEEEIAIHRISIRTADGTTHTVPLDEMVRWTYVHTTGPTLSDGVLRLRSVTGDPYLFGDVRVETTDLRSRMAAAVMAGLGTGSALTYVIVLGSVLAFLAGLSAGPAIAVGSASAALFGVLLVGPKLLLAALGPDRHTTSSAVGYAAFEAISSRPSHWTTLLVGFLAVASGLLIGRIEVRSRLPAAAEGAPDRIQARQGWSEFGVAAGLAVALSIALCPDVAELARATATRQFFHQWDANNLVTWSGLVARGEYPYHDFWYPYGGRWLFALPLPWGDLFRLSHDVLLYLIFGVASWRILDRRLLASLSITATVVILTKAGLLPGADRYLLPVAVALAFVAIDREGGWIGSGRHWFWLSCALALWFEPSQLVYAVPAVAITLIVDECRYRPVAATGILARAIRDFSVPAAVLLALAVFLTVTGELPSFITTTRHNAASAIYGAFPTYLRGELIRLPRLQGMVVVAPYIFMLAGALLTATAARDSDRRTALAVLCAGTIGLAIMQKHLVRSMELQLLTPSAVASLLLLARLRGKPRSAAVVAMVVGAGLAIATLDQQTTGVVRQLAQAPWTVASTWRTLRDDGGTIAEANRAAFTKDRFGGFKNEQEILKELEVEKVKSVFVLGDMPIFYILTPGPVPFHVNLYNGSPFDAQQDLAAWLERTRPDRVVFQPQALEWDGVPMVVRSPVVLEPILRRYVPARKVASYVLLKPREPDQAIPLEAWRDLLGPQVRYSRLLDSISADETSSCDPQASQKTCRRYLEIRFDAAVEQPQPVDLPIEAGALRFVVSFVRSPGRQLYFIPLDRIWFWRFAEETGLAPRPATVPGLATAVAARAVGQNRLY